MNGTQHHIYSATKNDLPAQNASQVAGLSTVLQWRSQMQHAWGLEARGRDYADDAALETAIDLYRTRVLALAPKTERPDDWATTQHRLGNALGALGQRQRGTRLLEQAIAVLQAALSVRSREHSPLEWAATQNSLGNTLGVLANAAPIRRCWKSRWRHCNRHLRYAAANTLRRTGP